MDRSRLNDRAQDTFRAGGATRGRMLTGRPVRSHLQGCLPRGRRSRSVPVHARSCIHRCAIDDPRPVQRLCLRRSTPSSARHQQRSRFGLSCPATFPGTVSGRTLDLAATARSTRSRTGSRMFLHRRPICRRWHGWRADCPHSCLSLPPPKLHPDTTPYSAMNSTTATSSAQCITAVTSTEIVPAFEVDDG